MTCVGTTCLCVGITVALDSKLRHCTQKLSPTPHEHDINVWFLSRGKRTIIELAQGYCPQAKNKAWLAVLSVF